ncbi:MAG: cobalt-precorrin-6A reductase [Pseudomonadota bacterium]
MALARILILGGTGEGFALAARLAGKSRFDVITSMAGATPAPKVPEGGLRRGGFGGLAGLCAYLKAEEISAVIDATHPFATTISRNTADAAAACRLPFAQFKRAPWTREAGDQWHEVDDLASAAAALPLGAGRVFLTTGKTTLSAFASRTDLEFVARIVARPPDGSDAEWPARLTVLEDKGPFSLDDERRLLRAHRIDWIVSKNSGGTAAYPKIVAARELGIPIVMVRRPVSDASLTLPNYAVALHGVDDAMRWLDRVVADATACVG